MCFTEVGYKLGQKEVRGGGMQLGALLWKLEIVFPFHFYCEYAKLQDRVPTSENKLKSSVEMRNEGCFNCSWFY